MRFVAWLAIVLWALPAVAADDSVLTYHGDAARSGNYPVPALNWTRAGGVALDPGFDGKFAGHLYAQPLFWHPSGSGAGLLIIATEDDTVVALDGGSGKTVWQRRVGTPVPLGQLPCGNIDPLGITATPVIDPKRAAIYFDAVVAAADGPHHQVFALSLTDGSILPGWPVDVAAALARQGVTFSAIDQNQRAALTLLGGRVFVPYGGHFGDCGDYHGWIVGVQLDNPRDVVAWRTRGRGGGIWAPGGLSNDGTALYAATGNTIGAQVWSDGEAVFRLLPGLRHSDATRDFFALSDWQEADQRDADLGGSNPVLFDLHTAGGTQKLLLALGKDRRAYVIDRRNLGGFGGSLAAETVANSQIITAPALYPAADGIFAALRATGSRCPAPHRSGLLTVLKIVAGKPPGIATAWCEAFRGGGSPIVTTTDGAAEPIVWILGSEGDNRLHAFRGDTGARLFTSAPLAGLRHFGTLIATGARLYVGADGHIYAFAF
jgi:outer membrane protein assembly factor BamB